MCLPEPLLVITPDSDLLHSPSVGGRTEKVTQASSYQLYCKHLKLHQTFITHHICPHLEKYSSLSQVLPLQTHRHSLSTLDVRWILQVSNLDIYLECLKNLFLSCLKEKNTQKIVKRQERQRQLWVCLMLENKIITITPHRTSVTAQSDRKHCGTAKYCDVRSQTIHKKVVFKWHKVIYAIYSHLIILVKTRPDDNNYSAQSVLRWRLDSNCCCHGYTFNAELALKWFKLSFH